MGLDSELRVNKFIDDNTKTKGTIRQKLNLVTYNHTGYQNKY
jgi:hypothetical protein